MSVKDVVISQQSISVTLSDIVSQGQTVAAETIGDVLELASRAGVNLYDYTGEQLTRIDYTDFEGITNHTKTLTYNGVSLESVSELFTYNGDTWEYDTSFNYNDGKLASKVAALSIT